MSVEKDLFVEFQHFGGAPLARDYGLRVAAAGGSVRCRVCLIAAGRYSTTRKVDSRNVTRARCTPMPIRFPFLSKEVTPLLDWCEELRERLGERLGMGQGGGVAGAGDLVHPCVGDVVGHVSRAGD